MDVPLRVTQDSESAAAVVQLIDNAHDDAILDSQPLADTSTMIITGSDLDDGLTLDLDSSYDLSALAITFDGGGNDALVGSGQVNSWSLSGADAGSLNERVTFTSVENPTGGAADDLFSLEIGASVSGTVTGGDGTDELSGPDTEATWTISGANAGSVDGESAGLRTCWRPRPFEKGGSRALGWHTGRSGSRRRLRSTTRTSITTEWPGRIRRAVPLERLDLTARRPGAQGLPRRAERSPACCCRAG